MKNQQVVFKDYVASLNEEDLRQTYEKIIDRFSGDIGDVINHIDKNKDINKFLHSAKNSDEIYDIVDALFPHVEKEYKKRFELISK
jgi:hypothetical protein